MNCLTRKFVKVTEHYGYQFKTCTQTRSDEPVFVVCRVDDHSHHISGYHSKKEAMRCCYYLEGLNYSKEKNTHDKN